MATRLPLQSGRFLIEMGTLAVANFQECSGLATEVEVLEVIEGGHNEFVHKLPGRIKYPNIVLKRGVTDNRQFADWRPIANGQQIIMERQNLSIILFDNGGKQLRRWDVTGAYPVKWTGPDMKATSMEIAIETLELAHQGWREEWPGGAAGASIAAVN
jgi:phage tail-like protein